MWRILRILFCHIYITAYYYGVLNCKTELFESLHFDSSRYNVHIEPLLKTLILFKAEDTMKIKALKWYCRHNMNSQYTWIQCSMNQMRTIHMILDIVSTISVTNKDQHWAKDIIYQKYLPKHIIIIVIVIIIIIINIIYYYCLYQCYCHHYCYKSMICLCALFFDHFVDH